MSQTQTEQASPDFRKPETITVHSDRVSCDGGGGPFGHPRVYMSLNRGGHADCPYCDRQFLLAADSSARHS